jgi:type IV secretory pathway TrbD component
MRRTRGETGRFLLATGRRLVALVAGFLVAAVLLEVLLAVLAEVFGLLSAAADAAGGGAEVDSL